MVAILFVSMSVSTPQVYSFLSLTLPTLSLFGSWGKGAIGRSVPRITRKRGKTAMNFINEHCVQQLLFAPSVH